MVKYLRELWTAWFLVWMMTMRALVSRSRQSVLGLAWTLLVPISHLLVYWLVFSVLVRIQTGLPYVLFLMSGLWPWMLYVNIVARGTHSIIENGPIIKKIFFHREVFPLTIVGVCLFDFLVAGLVFLAIMTVHFNHIVWSWTLLWWPFILLIMVIQATGVIWFTSAVSVFVRDSIFLVELAMHLWVFVSPIMYPIERVPERFRDLYMLNPVAPLIVAFRQILFEGKLDFNFHLILSICVSLFLFVAGLMFFRRLAPKFSDVI